MMKDITDYRLDMDGDFNVAAIVARPEPLAEPEPLQEIEAQPSPRITLRLTVEEGLAAARKRGAILGAKPKIADTDS